MNDSHQDQHWLVRPATIRLLWGIFVVLLGLTVLLQWFVDIKGYFGVDGWFGFSAIFGFLSCLVMVLVAKGLGLLLKRGESFYAEDTDSEGSGDV